MMNDRGIDADSVGSQCLSIDPHAARPLYYSREFNFIASSPGQFDGGWAARQASNRSTLRSGNQQLKGITVSRPTMVFCIIQSTPDP